MRVLVALLLAAVALSLAPERALADDAFRWRRTTPRAIVEQVDATLSLRVPGGRAWGVESAPSPVNPSSSYRVRVAFDVPSDADANAFLRLAFYARPDARGRQRARSDSARVGRGISAERSVDFVAPSWARAVKLRLLVRRPTPSEPASEPVRAHVLELRALDGSAPRTVLREVD